MARRSHERADHDHASRRLHQGSRAGTTTAARSRRRSAPGSPRPRSRPRSTASGSISGARSNTTRRSRSSSPRRRRRPRGAAALLRARHGPGGHASVPGREVHDRPRDHRRLLLRLRPSRRPHLPRDDLAQIEDEMRAIVKADQAFVRDEVDLRRRAGGVRRTAVQAGDHREGPCRRRHDEDAGEAGGDGDGRRVAVPQSRRRRGRVHRPVPGSARPVDGQAPRVQADQGRGRVLAGQREGPDAPAHLRHRVGVEEGARRVPPSHRRGGAARPSQARRRARPVLVPGGDRFRARGVPPEGRHRATRDGGVLARAPRGGRLRVRELAPHLEGEPVPDVRAPRVVSRTGCSRRCISTTSAARAAPTTT